MCQAAFRKVQQLRDETKTYSVGGDAVPVSLDDLYYAASQMYHLNVEVLRVAKGGVHSRGLVIRRKPENPKPSQVVLSAAQPDDWFRLAAAKELAHLVNDEPEDWSMLIRLTPTNTSASVGKSEGDFLCFK